MVTAVLSDFRSVKEFGKNISDAEKAQLKQQEYLIASDNLNKLAGFIESRWQELSDEDKNALRELAYSKLDRAPKFTSSVRVAWTMFQAHRQGFYREFLEFARALDLLIDTILSAIEREALVQAYVDFDEIDVGSSEDRT